MSVFMDDGPDGRYRQANQSLELALLAIGIVVILHLGAFVLIFS